MKTKHVMILSLICLAGAGFISRELKAEAENQSSSRNSTENPAEVNSQKNKASTRCNCGSVTTTLTALQKKAASSKGEQDREKKKGVTHVCPHWEYMNHGGYSSYYAAYFDDTINACYWDNWDAASGLETTTGVECDFTPDVNCYSFETKTNSQGKGKAGTKSRDAGQTGYPGGPIDWWDVETDGLPGVASGIELIDDFIIKFNLVGMTKPCYAQIFIMQGEFDGHRVILARGTQIRADSWGTEEVRYDYTHINGSKPNAPVTRRRGSGSRLRFERVYHHLCFRIQICLSENAYQ